MKIGQILKDALYKSSNYVISADPFPEAVKFKLWDLSEYWLYTKDSKFYYYSTSKGEGLEFDSLSDLVKDFETKHPRDESIVFLKLHRYEIPDIEQGKWEFEISSIDTSASYYDKHNPNTDKMIGLEEYFTSKYDDIATIFEATQTYEIPYESTTMDGFRGLWIIYKDGHFEFAERRMKCDFERKVNNE